MQDDDGYQTLLSASKTKAEIAEEHFRSAIQGNSAIVSIGSPSVFKGTRSLAIHVKSRYTPESEELYQAEMETGDVFPNSGLSIMILEERRKV